MYYNKSLFICLLFIFSFIPILQAENINSKYLEDLYTKAIKYEKQEDYNQTKQLYDEILKCNKLK